jgi:hypothetical protein
MYSTAKANRNSSKARGGEAPWLRSLVLQADVKTQSLFFPVAEDEGPEYVLRGPHTTMPMIHMPATFILG